MMMPLTFKQMVEAAMAAVPVITPEEAKRRLESQPDLLIIDVRDAAEIPLTGTLPGAAAISLGTLPFKADQEVPEDWRDPRLQDRARPIITTCEVGPMGALAGKLLHDMGFTNVSILGGGVQGWIAAGYATE
jgi:rhodanese-related sulfurtransferase